MLVYIKRCTCTGTLFYRLLLSELVSVSLLMLLLIHLLSLFFIFLDSCLLAKCSVFITVVGSVAGEAVL